MIRKHNIDPEEGTCSIADSSIDDNSRNSEIDTYSDRNSSSGLELLERAIHTLIVETRARDLDREVYQDPDRDRYLIPGYQVFFLSPGNDAPSPCPLSLGRATFANKATITIALAFDFTAF